MIRWYYLGFFPGIPSKLVTGLGLGGRVEQLWVMLGVIGDISLENCTDCQGSCLLGCQSWNEADMKFWGAYIALWYSISIYFSNHINMIRWYYLGCAWDSLKTGYWYGTGWESRTAVGDVGIAGEIAWKNVLTDKGLASLNTRVQMRLI